MRPVRFEKVLKGSATAFKGFCQSHGFDGLDLAIASNILIIAMDIAITLYRVQAAPTAYDLRLPSLGSLLKSAEAAQPHP